MPGIRYPRILALVEGDMEHMFIRLNFKYVDLVKITNGSSWTLPALCTQIGTRYVTRYANHDLIIVWLDKEKSACTHAVFVGAIRAELLARGAPAHKISICAPDQMTENLILADEVAIKKEFDIAEYEYTSEGHNGSEVLKQLYRDLRGVSYKKMQHGVALLKAMRLNNSAKNSPNANQFRNSLTLDCWWFQRS